MNHVSFRASACGRFIVSAFGSSSPPRVLTIEEATVLRDVYRQKQAEFLTGAHPFGRLLANHEKAVADLLDGGLREAFEIAMAMRPKT